MLKTKSQLTTIDGTDEELNKYLIRSLLDIVSENNVPKKRIQVFEINLTEELFGRRSEEFLIILQPFIPLMSSIQLLSNLLNAIPEEYKKSFELIKWKPSPSSVFPSEVMSNDLIVCNLSNELMRLSLTEQMKEIYDILVDRGFLLYLFQKQQTSNMTQEFESIVENYLKVAERLGFIMIGRKSNSDSVTLLLRKVVTKDLIPENEDIIYISNDLNEWFEPLKEKMRQVRDSDEKNKIWLISKESEINGVIGLVNCLRLEPGGEGIRCLFNCDEEGNPLDFQSEFFLDIWKKDLAINVIKEGKLGTYRHLSLPSNYEKRQSNQYL